MLPIFVLVSILIWGNNSLKWFWEYVLDVQCKIFISCILPWHGQRRRVRFTFAVSEECIWSMWRDIYLELYKYHLHDRSFYDFTEVQFLVQFLRESIKQDLQSMATSLDLVTISCRSHETESWSPAYNFMTLYPSIRYNRTQSNHLNYFSFKSYHHNFRCSSWRY